MYWRQLFLLFVFLFGLNVWVSSSIVSAYEFCVSDAPPLDAFHCPTGSSPIPSNCLPGLIGPYSEHTCSSPINPCTAETGMVCSSSSCSADTFRANSCDSFCSGQVACISIALFGDLSNTCSGTSPSPLCQIGTPSGDTLITVGNPLKFDTVEGILGSLLSTLQGIIVVLSLVFIVIGAVLYITSAGDEGRMKTAKGAITASMIGLALGIAAPSFLKQIGVILGWGPTVPGAVVSGSKTLIEIALNILQFLLSVVGILGIIMLVIGGLTYITALGDEGRAETGKKIVTYAIIGIVIALASLVVVTQIASLFV